MGDTYLLHCPHLCCLPSTIQSKIYAIAQHQRLSDKQTIVETGNHWQSIIWLKTGTIRLYTLNEHQEHNIAYFSDDDFLWPVTESLRNQPCPFTIETLTPVEFWIWTYDEFREQFKKDEDWRTFHTPWLKAFENTKSKSVT
ncbi:Crp/Fnr family transcriptional regulator [Vibrio nigripulchritudo ATCC 27043]|uniref:Crp/Fnr family transcriptional regulator n=1 Tax=Vibrio nigripulchritudo TaxID=28173 RepID=UPI00021C1B4B|nr:cyclic nucleotide-binding domain-containing protein [Vibrio nigripulchritudo]EGU61727.1 Crp/Fnr family transcriptional regulator [Vibrio nigripulchritudo ATCC 27043]